MSAVQLVTRTRYLGVAILGLAGALAGLAWWPLADLVPVADAPGSVLGFAVAVAIGELIALDEPEGRPVPASIAVIGAFVLLGHDPLTTSLVTLGGYLVGTTVSGLLGGDGPHAGDAVTRFVGAWSLPTVVALAHWAAPSIAVAPRGAPDAGLNLAALAAVSLVTVLGMPMWHAVRAAASLATSIGPLYARHLRATWLANVALVAGAGLAALVHADLGWWGLALTFLPLLAARSGLHRLALVRRTHDQTVRAMSRLAELVHLAPEGHGTRVADLVVSMGRDLGLSAGAIDELERAALLHEIGVVAGEDASIDAAAASASVVREVPHLHPVAEIIERHRDVPRLGLAVGRDRVPLPSRILRTACEFDRLIAGTALAPDSVEAVHHFHATAGHQHEPALVQALGRAVDRSLLL